MKIDEALEEAYRKNPDREMDVILTTSAASDALLKQLEEQGFETTSREQAAFGILYGRIRLAHLPALRRIKGIASISLDTEQHAF